MRNTPLLSSRDSITAFGGVPDELIEGIGPIRSGAEADGAGGGAAGALASDPSPAPAAIAADALALIGDGLVKLGGTALASASS